jgi:hypothetical protein
MSRVHEVYRDRTCIALAEWDVCGIPSALLLYTRRCRAALGSLRPPLLLWRRVMPTGCSRGSPRRFADAYHPWCAGHLVTINIY